MPDIREILAALDIDDRALWTEMRTIMRRSYLNAHNETVGIGNWSAEDDAFTDLIDIRLALLFDRAGRLQSTKEIIGNGDKIESDLKASEDRMKNKSSAPMNVESMTSSAANKMSDASKLLQEGFSSEWPNAEDKE